MDFSFYDSNKNIKKLDISAGMKWSDVKKQTDNQNLQSIFDKADANHDGEISAGEARLLNDLLKIGDTQTSKANKDNIADDAELAEVKQLLENKEKSRIVDSKDKKLPDNYSYIDINSYGKDSYGTTKYNVDFSRVNVNDLESGKYYMDTEQYKYASNGSMNEYVRPLKIQDKSEPKKEAWSEGVDRRITTIKVADFYDDSLQLSNEDRANLSQLHGELWQIGQEMGFSVETVHSSGRWVEDYSIRRADGKVYLQSKDKYDFVSNKKADDITSRRSSISITKQGSAAQNGKTVEYAKTVAEEDKVYGKSYLEGGNVLNTCKADGTPSAVIGSESIDYTLAAMGLENTPEDVETAKKTIAQDLGLKPEDVTYIPQYDFHIDMSYRPLHNGEIAVPDYDKGIELLRNTNIKNMDDKTKQDMIAKLEALKEKTDPITKEAEENLTKDGYKVVKMPCFSIPDDDKDAPKINFMNGVAGTGKKGKTFYITNKSRYPELNEAITPYFKKAGIKNVFFVSTENQLKKEGGIDCLTQEY
ncbi:hypothetical protein IJ541_03985 [bacterium]|nr:hypothetical protein [bacterium]